MATPSTPETARHTAPPPTPESVLLTVRQMAESQPALSQGSVRWSVFNAEYNGLAASGAVVRTGRRVLIDPVLYMAWMRSNPVLSPPRPRSGEKVTPKARPQYRPQAVAILSGE
ncbi:hypothetical protein [uncultured Lamprocystis sp.]|jgi:hypothetical protein|uniref:hypothetical protein n=1 Tax=uncultured Lamprocystis sp. TaxID=543132 RepID=UPI0025DAE6ED|nr:hypothetical protein [uncultured Lamprocystis sp.]